MKIGIDARFLTHPQPGGFKTYTQNLIAGLARVDDENEYILYVDREPLPGDDLPNRPNMRIRVVKGDRPVLGAVWREQVSLAVESSRDRLDLFHAPALTAPLRLGCPGVITLHDMIWRTPPPSTVRMSAKRRLMGWYYRRIPELVAARAAMIITVSNAARQDIVRQLGVSPQRVVVTLEAAHPMFRPVRDVAVLDAARMKYGLPGSYIMAIGSADPRKNMSTLIDAYARLPQAMRDQHHLAVVWTHPYMAESIAQQIDALDLKANTHFLHHVPNEDLAPLYSGAVLFAFPSRYEGFGLPLLEAMSCGTPVIAANNSSIPEIVGDAAALFSAEDPESITRAAAELLANPAARAARSRDGIRRAAAFSWDRCARETIDVYRCSVGYSPQPVANRS